MENPKTAVRRTSIWARMPLQGDALARAARDSSRPFLTTLVEPVKRALHNRRQTLAFKHKR